MVFGHRGSRDFLVSDLPGKISEVLDVWKDIENV